MNLHVTTELIDEVVAEALRHINRKSVEYQLQVQNSDEYLLAQIDAKLIVQVLINIVDNAIKYTPPGSEIAISWKRNGAFIEISVADNQMRRSRMFLICFTVRPIALLTAGAVWDWDWRCVNPL